MVSEGPNHQSIRMSLGAFVLGQLGGNEAESVRRHLETCALCRAEIDELAPVAGLLAETRQNPPRELADVPADLGERIAQQIAQLDVEDRRRHRVRVAVMGGLSVAAVTAAFLVGTTVGEETKPAAIPLEHVTITDEDPSLTASADIVAHTWGVEVKLKAAGFVSGESYEVSVLTADGVEHAAGEFVGTGANAMSCNLNSSVMRDEATGFEVRDAEGAIVLASAFPTPSGG